MSEWGMNDEERARVEKWNKKLDHIKQNGTIDEHQDFLVDAVEDLGSNVFPFLHADINDITWACKIIMLKRQLTAATGH